MEGCIMKKVLKKRYFIPLLVVAIMAIAATAAYAWWTTTVTSEPNNISTGAAALTVGGQTPINAANLIPQATLDLTADSPVPEGYKTNYFYVQNTGDTPLDFVGWLDGGTDDATLLANQVWVKITIAPTVAHGSPWDPTGSLSSVGGPYLVYRGPIGDLYGKTAGSTHLTTLNPHTPLAAGQYAFYRVVTWLDGPSCDNNSMHKKMSCTLKFESVP
jgi:hypothetical protein